MSSRESASAIGNGQDQLDQMSQPLSPLISSFPTPFASSVDNLQHFSEPQHYFERPDLPYICSDGSGTGSSHDFSSGPSSQHTSSHISTIPTPELLAYHFDETPFPYGSPPISQSLGPYFFENPSVYANHTSNGPDSTGKSYGDPSHQPLMWESSASNQAYHGSHYEGRRRSLSHSDVHAFTTTVATMDIRNPTFIRLQAPRSKPLIAEDRRKSRSRPKHTRSASYGPGARGETPAPPSPTPELVLLPTVIGTPLDQDDNERPTRDINAMALRTARNHDLMFEHMTSDADLARSRKIIQIGALMVQASQTQHSAVDPSLIDPGLLSELAAVDQFTTLLEKLSDVERHLESIGSTEEVQEACTTIRKALQSMDADTKDGPNTPDAMEDIISTDVASEILDSDDEDMITRHLNLEGNDLMTMLQNDLDRLNPEES